MQPTTPPTAPLEPRPPGKPWTFQEAAAFLSVSVKHLRFLADTNKIACMKIGRRKRLISDSEMKRLCKEGV